MKSAYILYYYEYYDVVNFRTMTALDSYSMEYHSFLIFCSCTCCSHRNFTNFPPELANGGGGGGGVEVELWLNLITRRENHTEKPILLAKKAQGTAYSCVSASNGHVPISPQGRRRRHGRHGHGRACRPVFGPNQQ